MNPFEQLKMLQQHQMFDEHINGLIVNKCVSFIKPKLAAKIDKYVFNCDKDILKGLFFYNVPNGTFTYIKSRKEEIAKYDFLFEKIKKSNKYSSEEMETYKPIFVELWKDKSILKQYFKIYNVDKKYYKKHCINIIEPIIQKNVCRQKRLF